MGECCEMVPQVRVWIASYLLAWKHSQLYYLLSGDECRLFQQWRGALSLVPRFVVRNLWIWKHLIFARQQCTFFVTCYRIFMECEGIFEQIIGCCGPRHSHHLSLLFHIIMYSILNTISLRASYERSPSLSVRAIMGNEDCNTTYEMTYRALRVGHLKCLLVLMYHFYLCKQDSCTMEMAQNNLHPTVGSVYLCRWTKSLVLEISMSQLPKWLFKYVVFNTKDSEIPTCCLLL